jgi:hypothetical protein
MSENLQSLPSQNVIIEITGPAETRSGNGPNGAWSVSSQEAYYHSPVEKYPRLISFNIESENSAYREGYYLLDMASSLNVGQYNALGFNRNMKLIPLNPEQVKQLVKH